jgi:hypothetical protein
MSNQRYPEEFKSEAVRHITESGLSVTNETARLGVSAFRNVICPESPSSISCAGRSSQ